MFSFFARLLRQRAPVVPLQAPPDDYPIAHQDDDGTQDLAVLRHAVLNCDKKVTAYAFFMPEAARSAPPDQAQERSFLTFMDAVLSGPLLGKRRALMTVPAHALLEPALEQLARSGAIVLLRFDADLHNLAPLLERMQTLCQAGALLGLADARLALTQPALATHTRLGFLPVDQMLAPDLLQAVRQLGSQQPQMQLFAAGVQSQEAFEVCRRLHLQGFTGPFATHRHDWSANAVDPGTARLCKLVSSLRAGAEMDAIVRDIKRDPLLSYRILNHANSSAIGAQRKVVALKDAILLIGREPLFRWLVLLLCASSATPTEDNTVLEHALVRGRLMELLADTLPAAVPEELFLTGVLSLLDVMLQLPAPALFATLDLPEAVKAALLEQQGPYAALLRLAEACEHGHTQGISDGCNALGITARRLNQKQTEALVWARGQGPAEADEATWELTPSASLPTDPLAAYTRAAEQGDAIAQWNLAVMLAHGQGDAGPDEQQSFLWCQKAADQGFAPAQATLGLMYSSGQGATKDVGRALTLLQLAAEQGDVEAQYNLAVLLEKELGGQAQLVQAFAWLGKAAAQGLPAAQERLGLMCAMGRPMQTDLVEAYKWFTIASEGQHADAKANLAHCLTLMEPGQVQEAQGRAQHWMHAHAATHAGSRRATAAAC